MTKVKNTGKSRKNIYVALEDADMIWDEIEVKEFEKMWKQDVPVIDIAKHFKRAPLEVAILILDRADKGHIEQRPYGLEGIT